jgi:antirestriction protein
MSIININNLNIDLSSLSEVVHCETHPNNKEIYYGCQSKQTHCEYCKNPGENNISIEQHFNELMDNINNELTKDITDILLSENFLICKIYKILILMKELDN